MARNRRLALALALTDDEEENHVPARLWVQISLGEGSSKLPTVIVQELCFDDARFAAYCDWSAVKKAPDVRRFFLTVEHFSTFFFTLGAGEKSVERRFKKRWGRFPKALCYIGIHCKKSTGRKKKNARCEHALMQF